MDKSSSARAAFLLRRAFFTLLRCAAAYLILTGTLLAFFRSESATHAAQRSLTFAERVAYQRAIENVYWHHRIWPKENLNPKPSLDAVMSQAQLRKNVGDYLRESDELENYWQRPITAEDLQAEMDLMAENTKQPEVLRELFGALGNDPFVIAECLARPVLSERLTEGFAQEQRKGRLGSCEVEANTRIQNVILTNATYTLPAISDVAGGGCTPDTWTATSVPHAPPGRLEHTAVWTGSEMIVWGGARLNSRVNTGGRYDPVSDSWTKTSNTNAPTAREFHTAVWTGSEMIVWGGCSDVACNTYFNTGGRYNPSTDTWTATTTANVPDAREGHTAVWTGSEMIVWGGTDLINHFNTGGRYNPGTDSWTVTSTTDAPVSRAFHTAVWTGSEMIVWGGRDGPAISFNTGARYDPNTDNWTATSTTNAPLGRSSHTAVWTGSEMIVWGGYGGGSLNTGGRYDVGSDSWTATTTTDAPSARAGHTAVWTGSEMIIWGGAAYGFGTLNTGRRYCAQSGVPTPTVTPTPTATATPTATGTVSPTPTATARPSPTPRPRPTPAPRPSP